MQRFLLGAFAELRKATITFVMSVHMSICPSFHPHSTSYLSLNGFYYNLIFAFFRKSVEKIQFSLKREKKAMSTLHKDQYTFMNIYISILLIMRDISDKFVEKIKTYILLSITFFFRNSCPF